MFERRDVSAQVVRRAERAGYKAIVLTVDVPKLGRREADIKNKLTLSHELAAFTFLPVYLIKHSL